MAKTYQFTTDGKFCILRWSFSARDNDPPHRHCILASHTFKNGDTVKLIRNRRCKNQAYWLTGSGDGLAGNGSRAINSVRTQNQLIGEAWLKAIESGNVEILYPAI